jgi:hypothetical protein
MIANLVLGVGGFILALSLLPSLRREHRPSMLTSAVCSVVLLGFTFAYADLGLFVATWSAAVNTVVWMLLLILKSDE